MMVFKISLGTATGIQDDVMCMLDEVWKVLMNSASEVFLTFSPGTGYTYIWVLKMA